MSSRDDLNIRKVGMRCGIERIENDRGKEKERKRICILIGAEAG